MIPFHKIYSWLFKSFNISGETLLIDRLVNEGYREFMIIKRSWIFGLFMLWLPVSILVLSGVSIFIAYTSIDIDSIKYTLIGGNILMAVILTVSSINYVRYFKGIHHEPEIIHDTDTLKKELTQGDTYFKSFFNWSITNQWILVCIIIAELSLIGFYGRGIGNHFWVLTIDTIVILIEIGLLRKYRKRMMDLEMDYNILVPGKIFFVNQSGLLSVVQTIEGDKIKTIQSIFPSKIASFFNYGTIHILTEGDTAMIGTMSMYYVTNPDKAVAHMQTFINDNDMEKRDARSKENITTGADPKELVRHTLDTREKIRDVLR